MNPSWLFEAGPPNSTLTLNDTSTSVPVDEWTHLAVTQNDQSSYTFYVNGSPTTTAAAPNPFGNSVNDNPLYIGSRADKFTTFNGNIDDVAIFSGVLTEAQIQDIMDGDFSAFGIGGGKLPLDIDKVGDELVFTWPSQGGLLYNLRSELDLSDGDPADWPVFDDNLDIEATPPTNTLTIPLPPDPARFFVIEEFPAPPEVILGDNFENGIGEWTTGSDGAAGTSWDLGLPSNVGPTEAHSPLNCFGTNILGDYEVDAEIWLRSPPIDLSTAGGATLTYWEFKDIEEGFDFGTIRVLDAADDSELAVIETDIDDITADWERVSKSIPAEALGRTVRIEFRFHSDDLQNFAGWYLDDFQVTVP